MKVIISHDVDHFTTWEHKNDLIIPKFIVRSFIELTCRHISVSEVRDRLKSIIKNKWHNLENLMKFNHENGIPSTFFFGVKNGKGLNYALDDALFWMKEVHQKGFDIGVHGIAFKDFSEIKKEHDLFKNMSGLDSFGIRMHYLRFSQNTSALLEKAGYLFDSSRYVMKLPHKTGNLWEFPLHIMDGYIICQKKRWQNWDLIQSKDTTKKIIEDSFNKSINYLTILFHDYYFSDSFRTWKEWYIWLITYMKDNKFDFISYKGAINELRGFNE